ncbi:Fe-S-containing protein [Pasteurella oralis]|uniref:Fe-S-containing protein n=1 Tax=Pasteurella oralis TaxID=1071947 RepID=UPI000C7BEE1F|nr:Fe-S-containing protein [Pasteurella oralis]
MNYFFTFLLQNLFPFALLLGCAWSYYPQVKSKPLICLTLISFAVGVTTILHLPKSQTVNLILTSFILASLLLFYFCQFFRSNKMAYLCHILLTFIAGIFWGKDPNLAAITSTDVINTDFILHSSAIILGLLLCLFVAIWLNILLRQCKTQQKLTALSYLITTLVILFLITPLLGELLLTLMKLQIIALTKPRLSFVAKSGNIANFFNYIHSVMLFIVLVVFTIKIHLVRKFAIQQESHPIEKRKKQAALLVSQRLIVWGIAIIILTLGTQLYWDKIASQPPRLSEATPVQMDDSNQVYIPIEQVKDGKLHRFVWIADDGKAVRFFLINRLPDRLSLAAVFDACILCGDQGYVMEGDQVVCVGCGVRMFIPSIGKPGGCNPVPIENWQQNDTHIIITKKSLEEGLNYFSTIVEIDVIDPVDHTQLKNTKTEHKYSYEGKTYFFASEKNLNIFREMPEQYIKIEGGQ